MSSVVGHPCEEASQLLYGAPSSRCTRQQTDLLRLAGADFDAAAKLIVHHCQAQLRGFLASSRRSDFPNEEISTGIGQVKCRQNVVELKYAIYCKNETGVFSLHDQDPWHYRSFTLPELLEVVAVDEQDPRFATGLQKKLTATSCNT